jgi:2-oxoglutarate ferredoxin oxidoreductase subunit alpha
MLLKEGATYLRKRLPTGYMRVRSIHLHEIEEFIQSHERIYVTEMNRDGQLFQLLVVYFPHLAGKLSSIAYTDGLPLTAKFVHDALASKEDF